MEEYCYSELLARIYHHLKQHPQVVINQINRGSLVALPLPKLVETHNITKILNFTHLCEQIQKNPEQVVKILEPLCPAPISLRDGILCFHSKGDNNFKKIFQIATVASLCPECNNFNTKWTLFLAQSKLLNDCLSCGYNYYFDIRSGVKADSKIPDMITPTGQHHIGIATKWNRDNQYYNEHFKPLFARVNQIFRSIESKASMANAISFVFGLPEEIVLCILRFLPRSDISSVSMTCSCLFILGKDENLWRDVFYRNTCKETLERGLLYKQILNYSWYEITKVIIVEKDHSHKTLLAPYAPPNVLCQNQLVPKENLLKLLKALVKREVMRLQCLTQKAFEIEEQLDSNLNSYKIWKQLTSEISNKAQSIRLLHQQILDAQEERIKEAQKRKTYLHLLQNKNRKRFILSNNVILCVLKICGGKSSVSGTQRSEAVENFSDCVDSIIYFSFHDISSKVFKQLEKHIKKRNQTKRISEMDDLLWEWVLTVFKYYSLVRENKLQEISNWVKANLQLNSDINVTKMKLNVLEGWISRLLFEKESYYKGLDK
eukprot:TRINITY_DN5438_c0_g1_i1.p1 TRINITY_DN5438_c0_g1~~TRINITY_DN5438_c0_g1_i1.p1  ORF type:complete len:546 (-),score=47.92 TRINITY_DN5438_c0_g1_i1:9-1646(-)